MAFPFSKSALIEEVQLRLGDPTGLEIQSAWVERLALRAYQRVLRETNAARLKKEIDLYEDANVYTLDFGTLKVFSVTYVYDGGATKMLSPMSSISDVTVGPTSARAAVDSFAYYTIISDQSAQWFMVDKVKIWPYPNAVNVDYDASEHTTATGAKVIVDLSLIFTEMPTLITPLWLYEATLLETVANSCLLPASKIKDQAPLHRQMADRAIREARRLATQNTGAGVPAPTRY